MPNNDYILRSDAINALKVSAMLRNLDSVEDGPAHRYKRAAERIIAGVPAADVEPKREWISVTERLPELNQKVLVYAVGKTDGFIGESTIALTDRFLFRLFPSSPGEETWSSPWQYFLTDYEITHWMPLPEAPEPPKEEKDVLE